MCLLRCCSTLLVADLQLWKCLVHPTDVSRRDEKAIMDLLSELGATGAEIQKHRVTVTRTLDQKRSSLGRLRCAHSGAMMHVGDDLAEHCSYSCVSVFSFAGSTVKQNAPVKQRQKPLCLRRMAGLLPSVRAEVPRGKRATLCPWRKWKRFLCIF